MTSCCWEMIESKGSIEWRPIARARTNVEFVNLCGVVKVQFIKEEDAKRFLDEAKSVNIPVDDDNGLLCPKTKAECVLSVDLIQRHVNCGGGLALPLIHALARELRTPREIESRASPKWKMTGSLSCVVPGTAITRAVWEPVRIGTSPMELIELIKQPKGIRVRISMAQHAAQALIDILESQKLKIKPDIGIGIVFHSETDDQHVCFLNAIARCVEFGSELAGLISHELPWQKERAPSNSLMIINKVP